MLPGTGLGDNPSFFHPPGEQPLPERIVYFVSPGVKQIFPLDEDLRPPAVPGEPFREIEWCWPARVVMRQVIEFSPEGPITLCLLVSCFQFVQRRHESFGHKPAAKLPEVPVGIRYLLASSHRLSLLLR